MGRNINRPTTLTIPIVLFLLIFFGCTNNAVQNNNQHESDQTKKSGSLLSKSIDTSQNQPDTDDYSNGFGENPDTVLHQYLDNYKTRISEDSTYVNASDTIKVSFTYYCTYDNKVIVPEKFVTYVVKHDFITHDFEAHLKIVLNKKKIYDRIIRKQDFSSLLDQAKKKYAVLLDPVLTFNGNQVSVSFNIEIPLTDVGINYSLTVDSTGNQSVREK